MNADRIIRWSTALAVVGVAVVAAVVSCELASALVREHGESGWTKRLIPLTVDGLIYASSMVVLHPARRKTRVPALARRLLGLGIAATPAASVAHGLGHGPIGAAVAAWSAVAVVGSPLSTSIAAHWSGLSCTSLPSATTGQARERVLYWPEWCSKTRRRVVHEYDAFPKAPAMARDRRPLVRQVLARHRPGHRVGVVFRNRTADQGDSYPGDPPLTLVRGWSRR